MAQNDDIPSYVKVRTNPEQDLAHRYDTIIDAKDALDEGSNSGAILAACDHAQQDIDAKADALEYLAERVAPEIVEEVADRLSTSQVQLHVSVATEVSVDE